MFPYFEQFGSLGVFVAQRAEVWAQCMICQIPKWQIVASSRAGGPYQPHFAQMANRNCSFSHIPGHRMGLQAVPCTYFCFSGLVLHTSRTGVGRLTTKRESTVILVRYMVSPRRCISSNRYPRRSVTSLPSHTSSSRDDVNVGLGRVGIVEGLS